MRILYAAIDQTVPGATGGSTHVGAVAAGLAARGHDVHVAARIGPGARESNFHLHDLGAPLGRPHLRLARARALRQLARRLQPAVVMERYHNFGGEGVLAARACGVPAVLEVNAPIVDYPGSMKARLDRALLVRPMHRWREWQCAHASLVVTPTRSIVPAWLDSDRVVELEWGADCDAFRPDVPPHPAVHRPADDGIVAVFAGAFRPWHGAIALVEAIRHLHERGEPRVHGLFIGDGPELAAVRAAAEGLSGIQFAGAVPHAEMPAWLAAADVGVAPFAPERHPPLSLAFYWSPLKIFEYMATGLPVVAPAIARLATLVRDGEEGVLYRPGSIPALAEALTSLLDRERRERLGSAARVRAVTEYSWDAHCRRLEDAIGRVAGTGAPV